MGHGGASERSATPKGPYCGGQRETIAIGSAVNIIEEHAGKTAIVRFPASTDVRWSKATKFSPGQEGFFLLHRGESKPEDRKRVAAAGLGAVTSVSGDVYTALHPLDFQPFDASDAVQQAIKG